MIARPILSMKPKQMFPPELLMRAQDVKVAFLDVDGGLTDGSLYFSEAGEALKCFHTLDGLGLQLLLRAGITPVIITGRDSPALRNRLKALNITRAYYGVEHKGQTAEQVLQGLGLGWHQAAAIGDDWPDLSMMLQAALKVAPPQAHPEVLATAHWVTQKAAGQGAAREFCDVMLIAQGAYVKLLQAYAQPASQAPDATSETRGTTP